CFCGKRLHRGLGGVSASLGGPVHVARYHGSANILRQAPEGHPCYSCYSCYSCRAASCGLLPQRSAFLASSRPCSVSAAERCFALPTTSSRMTTQPRSTARLIVASASRNRRTGCQSAKLPPVASNSL